MNKPVLPGSERQTLPGSKLRRDAPADEPLEVLLVLRQPRHDELCTFVNTASAADSVTPSMSREDFADRFGDAWEDFAVVEAFGHRRRLKIMRHDVASRTVVLAGSVGQFSALFDVELAYYVRDALEYRGRTGAIHLPAELDGIVTAVLGLDDRPQVAPRVLLAPQQKSATATPTYHIAPQVAAAYQFPHGDGKGQCIAIIELGGGYQAADTQRYFSTLGLKSPTVNTVSVGSARNPATGDADGPDREVALDVQIAGAVAPCARIVVYFATAGDAGFLEAFNRALHDTSHRPSVISISWSGLESSWTRQALDTFNDAFRAAVAMGVTVCVSSGDNGSDVDGKEEAHFPASSPYVLACGGTTLNLTGSGSIRDEAVWNDGNDGASSGGVSSVFALPEWQRGLAVTRVATGRSPLTMRGTPDVAANADPATGYLVIVDGAEVVVGGTSASAPLWAGLIARINSASGATSGFANARLYANPAAFNDITVGTNGSFLAAPGWDACTGLGSPIGAKIGEALTTGR